MIRTVCVHELDRNKTKYFKLRKALQKIQNLNLRELKAKIALTIDCKPFRTKHKLDSH